VVSTPTEMIRPPHKRYLIRNTTILAVTAASAVAVFLYPTSLNSHFAAGPEARSAAIQPQPGDLVVTGPAVKTQYGPVQVQIRVREGKVIVADAVKYPTGFGLDDIVNNRAIPILNKEAVAAQSAKIDAVSAATYTSGGYLTSLQAALDMAHLG
jgi:uncharacterized protein with FMN-binding domain